MTQTDNSNADSVLGQSFELHDDSVQDILSRPPRSIVRYGTGILFCIILLLYACFCFLSVPDVVSGEVEIMRYDTADKQSDSLMAIIHIDEYDMAKIKAGQEIKIRFNRYPSPEFGYLTLVADRQAVAEGRGGSELRIRLDSPMITDRKVELKYVEGMRGIADIVVGQRRLLSLDVLRQGEK